MQTVKNWLSDFWPQHLVVCLGLFGLGNLWNVIGFYQFTWFAVGAYVLTLVVLLARAILCFEEFCNDWKDVGGIIAYLLGALDAVFVAGFVAQNFDQFAGIMLWCFGVAFNVVLVVAISILWFRNGFNWDNIMPTLFLVYCSFGIDAIVAPMMGFDLIGLAGIGKVLTVISVVCLVITYPLVLMRILTRPLSQFMMPTLMLFEAAPCMNMVAWVNNFGTDYMAIPVTLVTIGQIGFLCLVVQSPTLVSIPFNKNFGAFTFPLAIGAMSVYYLADNFYTGMTQWLLFGLYWLELLVALIVITCVVCAFVVSDVRRFLNKPSAPAEALADAEE